MPVGSEQLICGQYSITYNSVSLGIFDSSEQNAPAISFTSHGERVNNSDRYGATTIDSIYTGVDFMFKGTAKEYRSTGTLSALYPWSSTFGLLGTIGRLYYGLAAPLVLTAVAGTPAASSPATLTANKAIVPPEFNPSLLFGPTLRKVPIELMLLPYGTDTATTAGFFVLG